MAKVIQTPFSWIGIVIIRCVTTHMGRTGLSSPHACLRMSADVRVIGGYLPGGYLKTSSMRRNSDRSLSGRKYQQSLSEDRDNNVTVGADDMCPVLVHSVLRDGNRAFTLTVPNNVPTAGLVSGRHHLGKRGSTGGDKRLQVWSKSCVICLEEGPGEFLKALQTLRNRLREVIGTNSDIGSNKGSEGDALVREYALRTGAARGEALRGSSPSCMVLKVEWVSNWKTRDGRAISLGIGLPMLHWALTWIIVSPLGDLGMDDRA